MVEIKEVIKGNNKYFYFVHSYRSGKKILKKEKYLGEKLPRDVEGAKKEFIRDFYLERFLKDIDTIKKNFNKEFRTMPKSAQKKQLDNFGIKFTYNTQRIEGSTLSLRETVNLLENGIAPNLKSMVDVREAEAHRKVFFDMLDYDKDLSLQIILKWHKALMEDSQSDIAGKIRAHNVGIAQSKFNPPMFIELELLLREFFSWYNKEKKNIHPVELAALVHLKFVTIHPFSDGNGRISRLLVNFILKKNNYPLLDISYTKRASYYNALERSQIKKDEEIFAQWFFRSYLKEYGGYLK